jgi:hypothetical protein
MQESSLVYFLLSLDLIQSVHHLQSWRIMFGFGHLYRHMITWSIIASLGVIMERLCSMSIGSSADCQRDRFMNRHLEMANSIRYKVYVNVRVAR